MKSQKIEVIDMQRSMWVREEAGVRWKRRGVYALIVVVVVAALVLGYKTGSRGL